MKTSLLAFLSLALLACAEPSDETDGVETGALVAPKRDDQGKARRPAPPRSCDDLQEQARTLLGNYQGCTEDADCTTSWITAPCLGPFLCQVAIGRDGKPEQLAREAASLSLTYRRTCGEQCPVARCISPESLHAFCDSETKRCKTEVRLPDASAPVDVLPGALDAGT